MQLLKYSGGTCCHMIFVKFTHDPMFSSLNHYEPIVKLHIKKEDEDVIQYEDVKDDEEGNADGTILILCINSSLVACRPLKIATGYLIFQLIAQLGYWKCLVKYV